MSSRSHQNPFRSIPSPSRSAADDSFEWVDGPDFATAFYLLHQLLDAADLLGHGDAGTPWMHPVPTESGGYDRGDASLDIFDSADLFAAISELTDGERLIPLVPEGDIQPLLKPAHAFEQLEGAIDRLIKVSPHLNDVLRLCRARDYYRRALPPGPRPRPQAGRPGTGGLRSDAPS